MQDYGLYPSFKHWLDAGQVYFYSDPHFGDEYNHMVRPNNVDDATQVANINSKVGKNDTIVILGDVGDVEWVKNIRGHKVLITGNHDSGVSNYRRETKTVDIPCDKYRMLNWDDLWNEAEQLFPNSGEDQIEYVYQMEMEAWQRAYRTLRLDPNLIHMEKCARPTYRVLPSSWTAHYDNRLFDEVYDGPLTISSKIILSHEPITDYPFAFNIHGHDHGQRCQSPFHYNMCAEHINYTPVSLKEIIRSGATKNVPDIHRSTIDKATERNHFDMHILDIKKETK